MWIPWELEWELVTKLGMGLAGIGINHVGMEGNGNEKFPGHLYYSY